MSEEAYISFPPARPLLTISIPTVPKRMGMFKPLLQELLWQRFHLEQPESVEIIYDSRTHDGDGNAVTLGAKGNNLLFRASGLYIARVDDDDWLEPFYLSDMVEACKLGPDCVGMRIAMTTDSKRPQVCCHSIKYAEWADNVDGYDFVRSASQFNAIRLDLAREAGFPEDIPYGDDHEFSKRVQKLCETEFMLERISYHYRFRTMEQRIKDGDA